MPKTRASGRAIRGVKHEYHGASFKNVEKKLQEVSTNVFSDILGLFGVPTGTAAMLFREFMGRRADEARDILVQELRRGNVDTLEVASEDEAFSIIYRYSLAMRDGAARRNLRLLARVMVGLAQRDQLFSDEFNADFAPLEIGWFIPGKFSSQAVGREGAGTQPFLIMDRSFSKQDPRIILRSRLPAEPRSPAIGTIPVDPSDDAGDGGGNSNLSEPGKPDH